MSTIQMVPVPAARRSPTALIPLVLVGAAVSVGLGVYGREHTPAGRGIFTLGFPAVINMKAWLTTIALALAVFQVLTALRMYGKLPGPTTVPRWLPHVHRWAGTAAFVATLPVAYHCLWSLGYQSTDARHVVHSILGCAFYGAFTVKVLCVRSTRLPNWALPVVGGLTFTILVVLWLTSALWFIHHHGFPSA